MFKRITIILLILSLLCCHTILARPISSSAIYTNSLAYVNAEYKYNVCGIRGEEDDDDDEGETSVPQSV